MRVGNSGWGDYSYVPTWQSLRLLLFHTLQTDPEGRTAVHYAAFFGKQRSLKFLIESASDWTPKYAYGYYM